MTTIVSTPPRIDRISSLSSSSKEFGTPLTEVNSPASAKRSSPFARATSSIGSLWSVSMTQLKQAQSIFEIVECLRVVQSVLEDIDQRDRLKFCKSDYENVIKALKKNKQVWSDDLFRETISIVLMYFNTSPFRKLPNALFLEIFLYLPLTDFPNILSVSWEFHYNSSLPEFWNFIYHKKFLANNPNSYTPTLRPLSSSFLTGSASFAPIFTTQNVGSLGLSLGVSSREEKGVSVASCQSYYLYHTRHIRNTSSSSPSCYMMQEFKKRLEDPEIGDKVEVAWRGKFRLETQDVYQGLAWWLAEIVDKCPAEGKYKAEEKYKIRYPGWESRWDEWVPRSRLRWTVQRNKLVSIYVGDIVELWCCGVNVPGAWLETKVKKIRGNRYCLGKVISSGSLWVERDRIRLVKRGNENRDIDGLGRSLSGSSRLTDGSSSRSQRFMNSASSSFSSLSERFINALTPANRDSSCAIM